MSVESQAIEGSTEAPKISTGSQTFARVAKYALVRLVLLFITVTIGVYLTIMIANMGGYVDNIQRGEIRERMMSRLREDEAYKAMDQSQKKSYMETLVAQEEKRIGLDKPFIARSFKYLTNALTLQLGQAIHMTSDTGSKQVRLILLERLPATLVMWGLANLILFFLSLFMALALSRRYGSAADKAIIAMTPTSSAPAWFYGIFLILIFAAIFRILPFEGAAIVEYFKLKLAISRLDFATSSAVSAF